MNDDSDVCVRLCLSNALLLLKVFEQVLQMLPDRFPADGRGIFPAEWSCKCLSSDESQEKTIPQIGHSDLSLYCFAQHLAAPCCRRLDEDLEIQETNHTIIQN